MVRRSGSFVAVALLVVLALGACDPVNPPEVGPSREAPVTYGPDPAPDIVATASEGVNRAVVWGDINDDLLLDRFNDSTVPATALPVTISNESGPRNVTISWNAAAVVLGNGFALISADRNESGPFGLDVDSKVVALRNPSNAAVPLTGSAASNLAFCDPDGFVFSTTALAWNGTTFLLAKGCPDTIELFTISTGGAVAARGSIPGSPDVSLASVGSGFLAAYEATNGAGNLDMRARRLNGTGAPLGGVITVAGGAGNQTDPVAAGSGSAYLVAWGLTGNGRDLRVRTIQSGGALGAVHVLSDDLGDQYEPALVGGGSGTWFSAWTEDFTGDNADVVGTKVLATGEPVNESRGTLAGGPGDQSGPQLTRRGSNAAFLTWLTGPGDGGGIDFTRKLDSDGDAFGPTSRSTRSPFDQECFDVAGGNGQYLVTWQETRIEGNTNLFARRFNPNGTPAGGLITVSTAPGDQFCPTAVWSGSTWLVVWTDHRSGTADVFGTFVSGAGAVSPAAGFPISARPSQQQSPSPAWNGSNFVVAWNDLRHGNQDIFAARVAPDGSVLEPDGLAVVTAPGIQRRPTTASAGGGTLIAWVGDDVQRRILRANGTFLGGIVTEGPTPFGSFGEPRAVASPSRLGVVFEDETSNVEGGHDVVLASINPTNGAKLGKTTIDVIDSERIFDSADVSFDGTSFVFASGTFSIEGFGFTEKVGTVTGTTVLTGEVDDELLGARVASLPDQRSLLVHHLHGRIVLAPVDDAP